jgi:Pectate lyase superfamily protein/Right handed beta helix region
MLRGLYWGGLLLVVLMVPDLKTDSSAVSRVESDPRPISAPLVGATDTWPAMDVPSLFEYELAQFADLSARQVNVVDFGATGNGTSDDTPAVQRALRAASGGTLFFPTGVYRLNSIVLDPGSSARLLGAGQGATVLEHADGAAASMLVGGPQLVHQLEIQNMTLDGNMQRAGSWEAAALEVRVDRLLVDHVEARHTVQQAIRLRTTTYTSVIRNSWFHDFQLHGPARNQDSRAVQVDHDLPSDGDVWFVGNRVEMTTPPVGPGNSVGGLRSSGELQTRLFVWNNLFSSMGQDLSAPVFEFTAPIDIYRNGDGSVIWGNRIQNSYYDGIRVMRSNDVQIVDNLVYGEGELNTEAGAGIHLEGRQPHIPMHDIIVRGNTVRDMPHVDGIRGEYDADGRAADVTVTDNHISGVRYGVYLSYVSGQVVVTRNDFANLAARVQIVNTDSTVAASSR